MQKSISIVILALVLSAVAAAPVAAAPVAAGGPRECTLELQVPRTMPYGQTVTLHVSGLPGFGGVDIFTSRRNVTDEAHLFLIFGITEFDWVYQSYDPENPSPPLEPGLYRVHATDANGCEARTIFRVVR